MSSPATQLQVYAGNYASSSVVDEYNWNQTALTFPPSYNPAVDQLTLTMTVTPHITNLGSILNTIYVLVGFGNAATGELVVCLFRSSEAFGHYSLQWQTFTGVTRTDYIGATVTEVSPLANDQLTTLTLVFGPRAANLTAQLTASPANINVDRVNNAPIELNSLVVAVQSCDDGFFQVQSLSVDWTR